MRKINILGFLSIFSLIIIIPVLFITKLLPSDVQYKAVKLGNVSVKAEVADTPLRQVEGLMSKDSLPPKEGMLFIFGSEGSHGIWMMNMSFAIDILWINRDLEIVDIAEDAQPCTFKCPVYQPDEKSLYVLEVNSGFVKKNGIRVGDSISIR
jgi:uncharacterized protein